MGIAMLCHSMDMVGCQGGNKGVMEVIKEAEGCKGAGRQGHKEGGYSRNVAGDQDREARM